MDLNTIKKVERPTSAEQITGWREGHAWLAGGTWLFSEPQPKLDTLIDLEGLNWPSLEASAAGLDLAATCRIEEVERFKGPPEWTAAPLLPECSHALLMSFKIAREATVGGRLVEIDAELLAQMSRRSRGTLQRARQVGADRQLEAADRLRVEHSVERRDLVHRHGRQPEIPRDVVHRFGRQPSDADADHCRRRREFRARTESEHRV